MRMSKNEQVCSLGLVESESERFKAYRPMQSGDDFIKIVLGGYDCTKAETQLVDRALNQIALNLFIPMDYFCPQTPSRLPMGWRLPNPRLL